MPAPVLGVIAVAGATSVGIDLLDTAIMVTIIDKIQSNHKEHTVNTSVHFATDVNPEGKVIPLSILCGASVASSKFVEGAIPNAMENAEKVTCRRCTKRIGQLMPEPEKVEATKVETEAETTLRQRLAPVAEKAKGTAVATSLVAKASVNTVLDASPRQLIHMPGKGLKGFGKGIHTLVDASQKKLDERARVRLGLNVSEH